MAMRRKKIKRIESAVQLRALTSPASYEIIQALRIGGRASVREIGARIGRTANSLHYHIRKLVRVGLIHKVEQRRSGARIEAVYDALADTFEGPSSQKNKQWQKLTNEAVAALLRLAQRNFERATNSPVGLKEKGQSRTIVADRYTARLSAGQLAEVNHHIEALHDLFSSGASSQDGQTCALTVVLTPIGQEKDK